ncbi:MAG TPA: PEGA domain-containing protein [Thermoanaerobaculia bacterium]
MKRSALVVSLALLSLALLAACSINTATPAPEAAPTGSRFVHVVFESSPTGAEVWVDGEFIGSTNLGYGLAPGKRVIEMRLGGFETWRRELTVREGSPTHVRADLKPIPR